MSDMPTDSADESEADSSTEAVLRCRGPDGWYEVTRGELPLSSDHWGAQLRVEEVDS